MHLMIVLPCGWRERERERERIRSQGSGSNTVCSEVIYVYVNRRVGKAFLAGRYTVGEGGRVAENGARGGERERGGGRKMGRGANLKEGEQKKGWRLRERTWWWRGSAREILRESGERAEKGERERGDESSPTGTSQTAGTPHQWVIKLSRM